MDTSGLFKTTEPTVSEVEDAIRRVEADLRGHQAKREDLKRRIGEAYPNPPTQLKADLGESLAMIESLPALIEHLRTVDLTAAQIREKLSEYRAYFTERRKAQIVHDEVRAKMEMAEQAFNAAKKAEREANQRAARDLGMLTQLKQELDRLMGDERRYGQQAGSKAIRQIEYEINQALQGESAEKASQDTARPDENEAA